MEEPTTARVGITPAAVLTASGAVALAGLTGLLAWYNADGWLARGLPLLAALAVATEAIAFLMAVCAELAWGRGGSRFVRSARVACCLVILIGCEAFNAAGSHEAWRLTMVERAETLAKPQRDAIVAEEARLRDAISAAQGRIDRTPRPDLSGGPMNDAQAIAAWEALTASDRAEKARAEAAFHALDRTIAKVADPFPENVVWAFLSFLGFVKVAGLWAIGVAFFRHPETKPAERETLAGSDENIVTLPMGPGRKEAVRALKSAGLSYGEIERRYGVRKGTAYRWCQ